VSNELEDRKRYCSATRRGGGCVEAGIFGTFKEILDQEIGSDMKILKSQELVQLVKAGKIGFNCAGMKVFLCVGPNRVQAEGGKIKRPGGFLIVRGKERNKRIPGRNVFFPSSYRYRLG
jgi:hypothetical protein